MSGEKYGLYKPEGGSTENARRHFWDRQTCMNLIPQRLRGPLREAFTEVNEHIRGDKQYHVYEHPTMCCCFPLRTGVFLVGIDCIVNSFGMVFFRQAKEDAMRRYFGGYAQQSRVVNDVMYLAGILMGFFGIAGAWNLKPSYIRAFLHYNLIRIALFFLMYATDIPMLWTCEMWRTDLEKAVQIYGWNHVMYWIAAGKNCVSERRVFMVCSTVGLIYVMYLTYCVHRLLQTMDEENKYLMRVPKMSAAGAFVSAPAHPPGKRGHVGVPYKVVPPPYFGPARPQGPVPPILGHMMPGGRPNQGWYGPDGALMPGAPQGRPNQGRYGPDGLLPGPPPGSWAAGQPGMGGGQLQPPAPVMGRMMPRPPAQAQQPIFGPIPHRYLAGP